MSFRKLTKRHSRQTWIAMDWTGTAVTFAEVTMNGDESVITRSSHVPWDEESLPFSDSERLGDWIRRQVESAGLRRAPVIVSLPRRDVIFRLLDIPEADDAETTRLIALQMESLEHNYDRSLDYDFVCSSAKGSGSRLATLVMCPREVTEGLSRALKHAGLTLDVATFGELAFTRLTSLQESQLGLLVIANDVKLELIIFRNGQPLACVAMQNPVDEDTIASTVQSTVSRMTATIPVETGLPTEVFVTGVQAEAVARLLAANGIPTAQQGPFPGAHAGRLLAVAQNISRRLPLVDLAHPSVPPDPVRIRRRKQTRIVALAAMTLCLMLTGKTWWEYSLNSRLTDLVNFQQKWEDRISQEQPTMERWEFLRQWQNERIDLPTEVNRFADHLPTQNRIYLTELQFENSPGDDGSMLRAMGMAKDNTEVLLLNQKLLNDGYELQPHGIEPSTRDSVFQSTFQIEAPIHSTSEINPAGESDV